jgi:hypothetical protein
MMVGTWLMCQGAEVGEGDLLQSDETGLQILGDGSWRKLTRNPAGQLQAVSGFNNYGTWSPEQVLGVRGRGDLSAGVPVSVAFTSASRVYTSERTSFLSGPAMMNLNGVYYLPASAKVLPAAPLSPSAAALENCRLPKQQTAPAPTSQSLIEHVVGTWLLCGTASIFGTDEVGLSISANQTWTKVTRNAAGQLVPMTGSGDQGTWNVLPNNDANTPGHFMFTMSFTDTSGSYTYDLGPIFGSDPATMQIAVISTSDYVLTTDPVVDAKA